MRGTAGPGAGTIATNLCVPAKSPVGSYSTVVVFFDQIGRVWCEKGEKNKDDYTILALHVSPVSSPLCFWADVLLALLTE